MAFALTGPYVGAGAVCAAMVETVKEPSAPREGEEEWDPLDHLPPLGQLPLPYPARGASVAARISQRETRGVLEENDHHGDGQSFQTGEEDPMDIGGAGGGEGKEKS